MSIEFYLEKFLIKQKGANLESCTLVRGMNRDIISVLVSFMKRKVSIKQAILILSIVGIIATAGSTLYVKSLQNHGGESTQTMGSDAFFAAAISMAGSAIGAGIAIYGAATAGFAAAAERPELKIWILIVSGLGEGLAIYGLVLAVMILGKI